MMKWGLIIEIFIVRLHFHQQLIVISMESMFALDCFQR